MTYGTRLGGATLLGYLVTGFAGVPVFAGGAGMAYMMGPTGGYLAGFFAAELFWAHWRNEDGHVTGPLQQRLC